MNVVGHPHIRVNRKPESPGRFDKGITKKLKVVVADKNSLTIVAALDDVLRLAGDHVAGKACHEDFDKLEITTLPF